jgi:hypothetical protein
MNTPTPAKQGVRQRERNALQRIEQLEGDYLQLIQSLNQTLSQMEGRMNALAEISDALIGEIGPDQVNARITAVREVKAAEQAAKAKEALELAITEGKVVAAPEVTDASVVTGVEYDKEGKAIKPGYVQLGFNTIRPEFQEKLKGQKAGFKVDTGDGSFEITGIYVEAPQPEVTQAEGVA